MFSVIFNGFLHFDYDFVLFLGDAVELLLRLVNLLLELLVFLFQVVAVSGERIVVGQANRHLVNSILELFGFLLKKFYFLLVS